MTGRRLVRWPCALTAAAAAWWPAAPALADPAVSTVLTVILNSAWNGNSSSCGGTGPYAGIDPHSTAILLFDAGNSVQITGQSAHADPAPRSCVIVFQGSAPLRSQFSVQFQTQTGLMTKTYGPFTAYQANDGTQQVRAEYP